MHIQRFLKNIEEHGITEADAAQMYTVLRRVQDDILYAPVARGIRGEGQLDIKQKLERITDKELVSDYQHEPDYQI